VEATVKRLHSILGWLTSGDAMSAQQMTCHPSDSRRIRTGRESIRK
jgi:hypothetical protein